jgi:hypothetical protein
MATRLPDQVEDIVRDTERTLDELDKRAYVEAVRYTESARARAAAGAEQRVADLAALVIMIASEAGRIEEGIRGLVGALDGAVRQLGVVAAGAASDETATRNGFPPPVLESKHPQAPR